MDDATVIDDSGRFRQSAERAMLRTKNEADERLARQVSGALDRAYRLAGLILGQAADAEDVAHDAAVRAWQSAGSLRDPDPFKALLDRDEALRLIRRLAPDERVVVVLHYWADLPLTEVALRLGWPVGTVKTRLHRALEAMREGQAVQMSGKVASR